MSSSVQASSHYFAELGIDPFFTNRKIRTVNDDTRYRFFEGESVQVNIGFRHTDYSLSLSYDTVETTSTFDGNAQEHKENIYRLNLSHHYTENLSLGLSLGQSTIDIQSNRYKGLIGSAFTQIQYPITTHLYAYLRFDLTLYANIERENRLDEDYDYRGRSALFGIGVRQ